ncbi:MAG TPA: DNA-directed RNA polymerase subunit omega [Bacilli bacterium]
MKNTRIKDGMRYPSIDQLVTKTKSKYKLVIGAAIRARQLNEGQKPLIDNPHSKKAIGIALEEIYEGKIEIK